MAFNTGIFVARFKMRFSEQGQLCENVYHVFTTGGWTSMKLDAVALKFKAAWLAYIAPLCTYQLSLNSILCTDITTPGALEINYTTGLPVTGVDVDGGAPMNVTLAIKWSTLVAGRSGRGRTFHLGLINNQIVDSHVLPGVVSSLVAGYNDMRISVSESTEEMMVVSKYSGGVERNPWAAYPIVGCSADSAVDSQRRRLPGRGS